MASESCPPARAAGRQWLGDVDIRVGGGSMHRASQFPPERIPALLSVATDPTQNDTGSPSVPLQMRSHILGSISKLTGRTEPSQKTVSKLLCEEPNTRPQVPPGMRVFLIGGVIGQVAQSPLAQQIVSLSQPSTQP